MSVDTDSYLNSIFSATRNSIISTSLGVGVYGFSRSLKKKKSVEIMKLLSTLLYLYSFLNLLNTNLMFRDFMVILNNKKKLTFNERIQKKYWQRYEYLNWILCVFTFIFLVLSFSKYLQKII